jgi:LuxR family maltose regulon positive regulatory protein
MTGPLLTTKLYIPSIRPRLISRPRLAERMSEGMHRKLTLISAPAGFGKSTLLSEWAVCCRRPVAWLSLDKGDNDPVRFLVYLMAALQGIAPDFGKRALSALQSPKPPPVASVLEGLINELAAISDPFVLVLDDYHVVETESIHGTLTFLLDHQPPQMHLALSTRTDPPLPIARLRGRGHLTELRQNDLRFTLEETTQFLKDAMGLQLSIDDVAALASRTEGWIAGLQMAAVSMQGRDDPAGFVQAFSGSHRHVLDYLVEEVLMGQPDSVQNFLLQTAILDRLTAPLCDAVCTYGTAVCSEGTGSSSFGIAVLAGRAGQRGDDRNQVAPTATPLSPPASSQEILEYLDRANLFVVPLDQERLWYRYHHLFADLMRQRLQQTQPDAVPDLHQRASTWYEQQGLIAEAIGHALSAKDSMRALQLVEQGAEAAVMRSEIATLQGWLEALPDEMVRARPMLCIYHTWALLLSGSPVEVAEARLQDAADADPDGSVAGEVLAVRALIATYQRKTRLSAELSRRALALLPEDSLFFRSFIAGCLGYSTLYSGDLVDARNALEESVRLSQRAGNLLNTVLALCHLGDVSMLEGHLHEGKAFYERALALAVDDRGQREPIAGLALIGLGQLLTLQYNLKDATGHVVEGIRLINRWGQAGAIGGYLGLARIGKAQGDLEAAHEAIQAAERLATEFDAMKEDDEYVAVEKAGMWLAQGDVEAVSLWLEESGLDDDVSLYLHEEDGSEPVPFNRLLRYMLVVRVHMARGRPHEALRVLRPLRHIVETSGWTLYSVRLMILESLVLHQQGNIPEALLHLERALSLSKPEGLMYIFIEEGAPMVELLRHAASRGIFPDYASNLLAHFEVKPDEAYPAPNLSTPPPQIQPLVEPLTERELDVLRLLATPLSTAEVADRLFVTVSTVRSHTKSIYAKLSVHRRLEAAVRAQELKLI